jgi:hypothetical protein
MGIRQTMHFESGILRIDAIGEFSLEEAKRAFLDMLGAVVQYHAKKVLLDGRALKGNPEEIERFYYGEYAAEQTIKLLKEHGFVPGFAYVMNEPLRDPRRFGENVAVNRGTHLKVFASPEEALAWLALIPADKPDAK